MAVDDLLAACRHLARDDVLAFLQIAADCFQAVGTGVRVSSNDSMVFADRQQQYSCLPSRLMRGK